MNFRIIFFESIFWSILWMLMLTIAIRYFPFMLEHDYPEDVKRKANLKKPSWKEKRNGVVFSVISMVFLFAVLIIFGIMEYKGRPLYFYKLYFHLWIICMSWNIADLIIVDWLLICKLSCAIFMLPGTQTYIGNKNYMFHFKGFLKGLIAMSVIALIASVISYGILTFQSLQVKL